jgi:FlaA1/EpsC-like NDP-sugar epimerase
VKKQLVIGGTGSLGRALIPYLKGEITVYSRDEQKQAVMAESMPDVKYVIGDVRDKSVINRACQGQEVVFHFAALKHVDILQNNPREAMFTNTLGAMNVADACIGGNVRYCVFCSTDKAVLPINSYGKSKSLASDILLNDNNKQNVTLFSVYTWGNVAASRGSVIPMFIRSLRKTATVHITDLRMTRFWITLDKAIMFVLDTYRKPSSQERIPVMKAASVTRVANMVAIIMGVKDYETKVIGIRPGEKLHECIYTSHEKCINSNTAPQYTDQELHDLLEPIVRRHM